MTTFLRKTRLYGMNYFFMFLLMVLSVGCNESLPDKFILQVQVQDSQTGVPIEQAQVIVNVGGKVPPAVYSDVHGKAIVEIDKSYADEFVNISVSKEGYKSQNQNIQVSLNAPPINYLLNAVYTVAESTLIPPQTPAPVKTTVPLPTYTSTASSGNTPTIVLAETPTPFPTEIIPTNTSEPVKDNDPIVVSGRIAGHSVEIYTMPSTFTGVRALFQNNDAVIVMGRTTETDGQWFHIKRKIDDIEGWVEAGNIQLTEGTLSDIPEDDTVPAHEPTLESVNGDCSIGVTIALETVDPVENVDQVRIRWENLPADTNKLRLIVSGLIANKSQYLVYPNDIDINDPDADGFVIEGWKFSERGFNVKTTFNYSLQAQDSAGNEICLVEGSFER